MKIINNFISVSFDVAIGDTLRETIFKIHSYLSYVRRNLLRIFLFDIINGFLDHLFNFLALIIQSFAS